MASRLAARSGRTATVEVHALGCVSYRYRRYDRLTSTAASAHRRTRVCTTNPLWRFIEGKTVPFNLELRQKAWSITSKKACKKKIG
ncbi:hypothetical protein EJB31_25800 [Klebsiella pneumoniae]|uniref:hypothetical protein n=1 Tax=Klebsiella pneumoniae TaxID=573 RepID=UPI0013E9662D|nr:hypothetical protein [Klebsiella pneumoniae]NGX69045.1 hypothetical protein [Klebsiella pneumoniae]